MPENQPNNSPLNIQDETICVEGKKIFIFRDREVLVGATAVPKGCRLVFEDKLYGAVGAVAGEDFLEPEGAEWVQMREYFASREEKDAALAARMKGLAGWLADNKYCGKCGEPLAIHGSEVALVCPACGKLLYPRISPCVIAVIERGDEILLLRHKLRNQNIFACLAGFVETGESLEQALRREVREEVGLEIKNIRYAGSQGWPFPDQLMVGFYAEYASGEVTIQESELLEARWFKRDELPPCPSRGSISYKLIHYELQDYTDK